MLLTLSPYPPTTPPTPLPPANAQPRLVKHLPPGYTESQLYDLFRGYGALASVRTQVFGRDTGVVEFWREEDARQAEAALHCADVEGSSIAIQVYQPRRASGHTSEFNASAPSFVPSGQVFGYPQVRLFVEPTERLPDLHHALAAVLPISPARKSLYTHCQPVYARSGATSTTRSSRNKP